MPITINSVRLLARCCVCAIAVTSLLHFTTRCASAQEPKSVPSNHAPYAVFESALAEITHHWNVAVVAEGSPVSGPKDPNTVWIKQKDTVDLAIERVAAAFDYAVISEPPVYVLTKRYSNADDTPDVTLEEAQYSLTRISRLFAQFKPLRLPIERGSDERLSAMYHALTKQQIAALGAGGVPVSSLNEAQRTVAWNIALGFYISPAQMDSVEYAADLLTAIVGRNPEFLFKQLAGINEFGFQVKMRDQSRLSFNPLSHPDTLSVMPNGSIVHFNTTAPGSSGVDEDPTEPVTGQNLGQATAVTSAAPSLRSIVARLNKANAQQAAASVDSQYGAKSVTIAGDGNVSASRLMAGLADVYRLSLRHRTDGTIVITHPDERVEVRCTDMSNAVRDLIPANIQRLLHTSVQFSVTGSVGVASSTAATANKKLHDMIVSATRAVRTSAQPAVLRSFTHTAPISVLSDCDCKALAFIESIRAFNAALTFVARPVPAFIFDFDHIALTGGVSTLNGRSRMDLYMSYTDPNTGRFFKGSGVTGWLPAAN